MDLPAADDSDSQRARGRSISTAVRERGRAQRPSQSDGGRVAQHGEQHGFGDHWYAILRLLHASSATMSGRLPLPDAYVCRRTNRHSVAHEQKAALSKYMLK